MHANVYDFEVMPLTLTLSKPEGGRRGGGGGGEEGGGGRAIVPAATLNPKNFFDILANALKLQKLFRNLS